MSANDNAPRLSELETQIMRKIAGCGAEITVEASELEVKAALSRLIELGYIEMTPETRQ